MREIEFYYDLYKAGFTPDQCGRIKETIDHVADQCPNSMDELRGAARQYLFICTDITKLRGFLLLVDEMNRKYAVSWEDATGFVLKVVCGWCA